MTDPDYEWRQYEAALHARDLEIDLFWRRGLFFWTFIAVAAAGLAAALKEGIPLLALAASSCGFLISICWTFVNRGSRYWFVVWEKRINDLEERALGIKMFGVKPPDAATIDGTEWLSARRFSVSRLAIAVSDFVTLAWFIAMLAAAMGSSLAGTRGHLYVESTRALLAFVIVAVTVLFSCLALWSARQHQGDLASPQD